jgi:GTP diphosphokinase / guanosine-3',5'-bis(diphosphate) 3'-diphosphatase
VTTSRFTFEVGDPMHLRHVLRAIRSIDGVYDVHGSPPPPEETPSK